MEEVQSLSQYDDIQLGYLQLQSGRNKNACENRFAHKSGGLRTFGLMKVVIENKVFGRKTDTT